MGRKGCKELRRRKGKRNTGLGRGKTWSKIEDNGIKEEKLFEKK